jgi:hypothetical protein
MSSGSRALSFVVASGGAFAKITEHEPKLTLAS